MSRHIAVLMGGRSAEREVSLVSGAAVAESLRAQGHPVTVLDVGPNIATILSGLRPDVAFNALHGRGGEDGCIQGVLETLGIPYTHSGVLASALAMDKPMAKKLFGGAGITCPEGELHRREEVLAGDVMDPPYVVKPAREGSSVGIAIVLDGDNARPNTAQPWPFGDEVLVERYIPGREICVAIQDGRPLGVLEIRPKGRFYDYDTKYTEGLAEHFVPASLPPEDYDEAMRLSFAAHQALGCRGVTRADLRYDDTGDKPALYLLEVNTQPGMTPLSLVPEIAAAAGISFGELVSWMVDDAGCAR
jgi:D-alanine-D-alanine ligase